VTEAVEEVGRRLFVVNSSNPFVSLWKPHINDPSDISTGSLPTAGLGQFGFLINSELWICNIYIYIYILV